MPIEVVIWVADMVTEVIDRKDVILVISSPSQNKAKPFAERGDSIGMETQLPFFMTRERVSICVPG